MKTSRAAAKRFKATGTGKLKRSKAYKLGSFFHYRNIGQALRDII